MSEMALSLLPDARLALSATAAAAAFSTILDGGADDASIAEFLTAMAERGETVGEVTAAAQVLRDRALTVRAPAGAIDVVGTGGDGKHTLNVSTAVAIVVAACGVPVAKHGNRAASSRSGASDVLRELGIATDVSVATIERGLATLGICYMHAASHHAAIARVATVRRTIGRRTIFNLLGPLLNPAGVQQQLVGVFDGKWMMPMAQALAALGSARAMVVHGDDGIDELTVTGSSRFVMFDSGGFVEGRVHPADAGLATYAPDALTGGAPADNAAALVALLAGQRGAYRDIVLLNAAAALRVAGRSDDWKAGAALAAHAIDSGAAADLLARWKAFA